MEDVSNTGRSLGGGGGGGPLEIRLVLVKGAHIKHPTPFVN